MNYSERVKIYNAMQFAQVYDATDLAKSLLKARKLCMNEYASYQDIFIFRDVHDFWVYRTASEAGKTLVEMEKISHEEAIEALNKECDTDLCYDEMDRQQVGILFDTMDVKKLATAVIIADDDKGLENYDSKKYSSHEDAVDVIKDICNEILKIPA